ncbi:MAG: ABC transporter substrate-binding protein [Candidatus Eremiobacteraeota bacterium]|nr:ABC transporter substrate-binding protein [Candidatus Eremiobacteraeota bacterium]
MRELSGLQHVNRPRIVSLLPSATEIVCALGAAANLVGISHECDYPDLIRDRPVLTSSRIDPAGSSREIDSAVREVLTEALSVYSVDYEKLGELSPNIIITQDLCEVCAVSLDDVRAAVARLASRDSIQIVSLKPTRLRHVFDDVLKVATALQMEHAGKNVRSQLQARVDAIQARASRVAARPRVVTLEWLNPIMLGGTWMPELIELAGGLPVGAQAGQPAPTLQAEDLKQLDPDVVLVKPCGFSLARTLQEQELIDRFVRPALRPHARLYITDGNAYFNRPGPRLVESLEIMAACLHPLGFADFADHHRDAILRA